MGTSMGIRLLPLEVNGDRSLGINIEPSASKAVKMQGKLLILEEEQIRFGRDFMIID